MSALDTVLQKRLAGASLTEALADVTADNPQLAALTQVLALREQQATAEAEEAELADAELADTESAAADREDQRYAVLQQQFASIVDDVGRLQDTLETVAAALGACPVCLGADAECLLCRGRGLPGSLPPDPAAFDQVALPAVRARAFARSHRSAARPQLAPSRDQSNERSAE